MSTAYERMKSKATYGIMGLLVVVVALLIIFTGNKDKSHRNETQVMAQDEVSSLAMEPVVTDEYTYTFEGIKWEFPVEAAGTRVNFMFENFSRVEDSYISFGNPYKLGFYQGECQEIPSIVYDIEANPGTPLSYAQCVSEGLTQQFALFQQGEEVVAKLRRYYGPAEEGDAEPEFVTLYTVNLTEIVN